MNPPRRFRAVRSRLALGIAALGAGIVLGWQLHVHAVLPVRQVVAQPQVIPISGTEAPVTREYGSLAELMADNTSSVNWSRPQSDSLPSCFEGDNLRRTWVMDDSRVQWIDNDRRYEEGRFTDGKREGCWSFWYLNGLFDSGRSGSYEHDIKVESAPSPLGDFGRGDAR